MTACPRAPHRPRLPTRPDTLTDLLTAGATAVEVDVQLYAGQLRVSHSVPVVRHAPYLRVEGKRFTLSRRPPGRTLADVLAELPAGLPITYDLKNEQGRAAHELVTALVAQVAVSPGSYVASPDRRSLATARAAGWSTMLSVGDRRALSRLRSLDPGSYDALAIRHALLPSDRLAADGLARLVDQRYPPIIAWVVDDPSRALELQRWGVAGITSDRAEVFRALTGSEG